MNLIKTSQGGKNNPLSNNLMAEILFACFQKTTALHNKVLCILLWFVTAVSSIMFESLEVSPFHLASSTFQTRQIEGFC